MSNIYFYDKDKSISVVDETLLTTGHTFLSNNTLWEIDSINDFYNLIDDNNSYNIVDIGAQSGLYSLYAKFKPNSFFYAFEPFDKTFKILNENINLNEIKNIKTFNLAVSNKKGNSILNVCESHNELHTLGKPLRFNDIKQISIETTTLDDEFYNKNIKTDFIKIDTEGHEYFILKGGINTIEKYKPIIQLEWNIQNMNQCEINCEMIDELINDLNYYKISQRNEEVLIGPNI